LLNKSCTRYQKIKIETIKEIAIIQKKLEAKF